MPYLVFHLILILNELRSNSLWYSKKKGENADERAIKLLHVEPKPI